MSVTWDVNHLRVLPREGITIISTEISQIGTQNESLISIPRNCSGICKPRKLLYRIELRECLEFSSITIEFKAERPVHPRIWNSRVFLKDSVTDKKTLLHDAWSLTGGMKEPDVQRRKGAQFASAFLRNLSPALIKQRKGEAMGPRVIGKQIAILSCVH